MNKICFLSLIGLWFCLGFQTGTASKVLSPLQHVEHTYPQDYFTSPVGFPIRLTGTFGELRTNHFHSGIDIKSPNGKTGAPVFSVADGYIYRIKIAPNGYGNALYIKHPNGYTSVYGHLEDLRDDVESYLKTQQYAKESFEVNLYPTKGKLPVYKGKQIGTLGNSGSSSGPHLHFEIRHSGTDKALNPLLFNLPVNDQEPPNLRGLKTYILDDEMQTLDSRSYDLVKTAPGQYKLAKDTISLSGWRAGFAIKAYDSMTDFVNDNGIYAITMKVDGEVQYHFRMEELDFDESRYMNAHIDYEAKKTGKGYYQRCFRLPGDKLNNYGSMPTQGAIPIFAERPIKIEIKTIDAHSNAATLTFYVVRDAQATVPSLAAYQYLLPWNQDNKINLQDLLVEMPRGCFYQTVPMRFVTSPDQSYGSYSSVFHLHNETVPVHRYYNISILADQVPAELRKKAFIADCTDSKPVNCGGDWKGNWLHTRTRSFGNYSVLVDTEPPKVIPVVFTEQMQKKSKMVFKIKDNFEVSGIANDLRYRATVDGKWILMKYDLKSDRITHDFDGRIGTGEHILKIFVSDDRGNSTVFEQKFIR
jgi:hypothetical protein